MNITGSLTPDGKFTGALTVDKAEQAQWLALLQASQPKESPIQRVKRIALHDGEIEADVTGIPILGTVTADVALKVEDG